VTDLNRDIGALEARADAQDQRLQRIEQKVDVLVEALAQSRGGIKVWIAKAVGWLHSGG
jgi:hypothetical protein